MGLDPIELEIIRHAFLSVPNHIEKNIVRTAFSPLIYEYKDFAVGVLDADAKLISQGRGSLPIFVANALGAAVADGLSIYGVDNLLPGDVVITNHAGTLGQHLNNVVMYTPIFADDGRALFGFMAVLAHWMDVGGAIVGSFLRTDSTEIFQEGIQFRTIKLRSQGAPVMETYRLIETNTRFPAMVLGDIDAQLAGCLMGRDLVNEIIERFGAKKVREAVICMWEQTEKATRASIANIVNGEYRATALLDDDGIEIGKTLPVDVLIKISDGSIEIDLSGLGKQAAGPINAGFNGGALAACRIACKYLFTPGETGNDGAFRPLKVVVPDGTFLSASATAPMGWSGTTLPTVVDTIIRALSDAAPELVTAAHHGTYGNYVFHGISPETGELFQHIDSSAGGWGAGHNHDGTGPSRSVVHGDIQDVPAEMQEAMYPLRILSVALRQDSAGAGTFRGGPGIERLYEVLCDCILTTNFDRTRCPPWGIKGGLDGASGYVEIQRLGAPVERIYKGMFQVRAGDRVRIATGGGGGFGPPSARDPSSIKHDVSSGILSETAARRDYAEAFSEQ